MLDGDHKALVDAILPVCARYGLDQRTFAAAHPDEAFSRYGAKQELIAEVKEWALKWSTGIGFDIAESESWSEDADDQDGGSAE